MHSSFIPSSSVATLSSSNLNSKLNSLKPSHFHHLFESVYIPSQDLTCPSLLSPSFLSLFFPSSPEFPSFSCCVLICCEAEADVWSVHHSKQFSLSLCFPPSLTSSFFLGMNVNKVYTLKGLSHCDLKLTWSRLLLCLHTFKLIGMCEPGTAFHLQKSN